MTIEERLKMFIIGKYGTVLNFSKKIGLPNSTVVGVLTRGVHNSGVDNVVKICNELDISVDALAEGRIEPKKQVPVVELESDIAEVYAQLVKRLSVYNDMILDGEPLSEVERFTLCDSLELELEKIRRVHDRERRKQ